MPRSDGESLSSQAAAVRRHAIQDTDANIVLHVQNGEMVKLLFCWVECERNATVGMSLSFAKGDEMSSMSAKSLMSASS